MNPNKFKRLFPNASLSTRKLNEDGDDCVTGLPVAQLERSNADELARTARGEGKGASRVVIRLTSYRKRLLDDDNHCQKLLVDSLRYSSQIHDDGPHATRIETAQEQSTESEFTVIQITYEQSEVKALIPETSVLRKAIQPDSGEQSAACDQENPK